MAEKVNWHVGKLICVGVPRKANDNPIPDKRWQVRVDEEGKIHWFDTKHMYGKYTVEEILEAMDKSMAFKRANKPNTIQYTRQKSKKFKNIGC